MEIVCVQKAAALCEGPPCRESKGTRLRGKLNRSGDNALSSQPNGAHVFAVNRLNGNLIWSTQVDSNPAGIVTSSPVAFGNEIVVGIASNEEADAESASYPCCSCFCSTIDR